MLKNGPCTRLIPDLKGVDPDDAFSIVPYEKGFTLLFYLETLLGGPGETSDRVNSHELLSDKSFVVGRPRVIDLKGCRTSK